MGRGWKARTKHIESIDYRHDRRGLQVKLPRDDASLSGPNNLDFIRTHVIFLAIHLLQHAPIFKRIY
jgi:hypothetical protein